MNGEQYDCLVVKIIIIFVIFSIGFFSVVYVLLLVKFSTITNVDLYFIWVFHLHYSLSKTIHHSIFDVKWHFSFVCFVIGWVWTQKNMWKWFGRFYPNAESKARKYNDVKLNGRKSFCRGKLDSFYLMYSHLYEPRTTYNVNVLIKSIPGIGCIE